MEETFSDVSTEHSHPLILNTSFLKYRPMFGRGSTGVPRISGQVLVRSISADNQSMCIRTLDDKRSMSDRYALIYDRCMTEVIDIGRTI